LGQALLERLDGGVDALAVLAGGQWTRHLGGAEYVAQRHGQRRGLAHVLHRGQVRAVEGTVGAARDDIAPHVGGGPGCGEQALLLLVSDPPWSSWPLLRSRVSAEH